MKRGQPLRRTELKPGKPLQRKTVLVAKSSPPRTGAPLPRRSLINPVSEKRRRINAERTIVVSAMRERSDGRCPRCGCTGLPMHGHERRPRSQDSAGLLAPDVLVCDPCNGAIADSPRVSCWNGWYVSPKWPHDPALEPWQARALNGDIVSFEIPKEEAA